ncbi:MAG: kinase [Gammaproteobacteria bacterium]
MENYPSADLSEDELAQTLTRLPWQEFLHRHQLNEAYPSEAIDNFSALLYAALQQRQRLQRPLIIGINGAQGSGKSTLADWLVSALSALLPAPAVALSIDDFYLSREQRMKLAATVHPLLATRGVPGTHDVPLAQQTLAKLVGFEGEVSVPRFDKSRDDRLPEARWSRVSTPVSAIVLEGWCLGVTAQQDKLLKIPLNRLEQTEDSSAEWRSYANRQLAGEYQRLWDQVDLWAMLRAPGFETVYHWRLEQEQKLAQQAGTTAGDQLMDESEIARFIQFYQRLTEHAMATLPERVHFLYQLDSDRRVVARSAPRELTL